MRTLKYVLQAEDSYKELYFYEHIDKDEISLRYDCDFFVKDGVVYEKVSTEEYGKHYVIYVKRADDEEADTFKSNFDSFAAFKKGYQFEVRHFKEGIENYPLVTLMNIYDDDDLTLKLKSDYINVNGETWEKTSTEIDEDRKTFVYYAIPIHEN